MPKAAKTKVSPPKASIPYLIFSSKVMGTLDHSLFLRLRICMNTMLLSQAKSNSDPGGWRCQFLYTKAGENS